MKKRYVIYILIIIAAAFSCSNESGSSTQKAVEMLAPKLIWHWEDEFSLAEKTKVKKYMTTVSLATFNTLGQYPFDIHFYFKRTDNKNEPIPWAHTSRSNGIQGVHFTINPEFDYDVMFQDWTAPHEIAHLAIPFVGKENAWFSEGFATFMQYQIMHELGIYTNEEVELQYQKKIKNIQDDFSKTLPFTESVLALRAKHNYPAMYWGGANYFRKINKEMIALEGFSLATLIKEYQLCCRSSDHNIELLLNSLDKGLKEPVFKPLFKECSIKPYLEIYKRA